MDNDVLLIQRTGNVCTLVLNRPEKRNSLSPELLIKLTQALEDFSKDDTVRAVVIRGVGDKAFCAGYDLGAISVDDSSRSETTNATSNPFETAMETIVNYPYPVIAMMNGYAFGGGCDLAVSCDIRIGVENVRIGMVPAKLGVVYSPSGLKRFMRVVGMSNAKELFFTARTFEAAHLKEIGFLNHVVSAAELESFTYSMAEEIAGNAPLSLKGIKRNMMLLTHSEEMSEDDKREAEVLVGKSFLSEDFKEGQTAFFEKRKPSFKGK
ncbi:MAG: enoyl-CoA hydratase [Proteobacteria bacterium]|nr:enoyl-CoA hydratase [Pseudomonadota bacterium]